jgi:hypothetical protein
MDTISSGSFCFGAIYGFLTAGIIALIAGRMREARLKMDYKDRPYDKFPNALQSNLTASQVLQTSWHERWVYTGLSVVLVVVIGLTLTGVFMILS